MGLEGDETERLRWRVEAATMTIAWRVEAATMTIERMAKAMEVMALQLEAAKQVAVQMTSAAVERVKPDGGPAVAVRKTYYDAERNVLREAYYLLGPRRATLEDALQDLRLFQNHDHEAKTCKRCLLPDGGGRHCSSCGIQVRS